MGGVVVSGPRRQIPNPRNHFHHGLLQDADDLLFQNGFRVSPSVLSATGL
ncbi:hypothetical protein ACFSC3_20290 [Sphingomonas floccifaciens]|uniref:Uncharacterized protein n=1 Tax=Sphingomonas floccifaciens TaxID=1844115 RepID=A0ABW4NIA9_9SPHN